MDTQLSKRSVLRIHFQFSLKTTDSWFSQQWSSFLLIPHNRLSSSNVRSSVIDLSTCSSTSLLRSSSPSSKWFRRLYHLSWSDLERYLNSRTITTWIERYIDRIRSYQTLQSGLERDWRSTSTSSSASSKRGTDLDGLNFFILLLLRSSNPSRSRGQSLGSSSLSVDQRQTDVDSLGIFIWTRSSKEPFESLEPLTLLSSHPSPSSKA